MSKSKEQSCNNLHKGSVKTQSQNNSRIKISGMTKQSTDLKQSSILKIFKIALIIFLFSIIFFPPFFKGLFFEAHILFTEIVVFFTFLVFLLYKLVARNGKVLLLPIDYAALSLVGIYFISIFFSIQYRLALGEWLKYCMYFAVFFMISDLINTQKLKFSILWVVIASTACICLLGIDSAAGGYVAGVFNKLFAYFGWSFKFAHMSDGGRVGSVFQYPNTLAAYIASVFFILVGLTVIIDRLIVKIVSGLLGFLYIITLILTLSRGAILIFPIALLLFIVLLPKGIRMKAVIFSIAPIIIASLFSVRMSGLISNPTGNEAMIWIYTLAGMLLSSLFVILVSSFPKFFKKVNWKIYIVLLGLFIALAVIGFVHALNISVPVILTNTPNHNLISKSVYLKPDKEYRLIYDVNATSVDKGIPYNLTISSQNEKQVILGTVTQVTVAVGKSTSGVSKEIVKFRVPKDSRKINILLVINNANAQVILYSTKFEDIESGKIKEIVLEYKYLPNALMNRLYDMDSERSNAIRMLFLKDGLKIMKDRWFIGYGGGAWALLYTSYQDYSYTSTQAHNYFLQTGIETGIIGLLIVLFLIGTIVLMFLSKYRIDGEEENKEKVFQASMLVPIVVIFAHSAIDFDLSFSSVNLLLWVLISLFCIRYRRSEFTICNKKSDSFEELNNKVYYFIKKRAVKIRFVPMIALTLAICVWSIMMYMSLINYQYGYAAAKAYNGELSEKFINAAVFLDPLNPEYKLDYAKLLIRKAPVTKEKIALAEKLVSESIQMGAKNNGNLTGEIGSFYLFEGNITESLKYINRTVALIPLDPTVWHIKVAAYWEVAKYYIVSHDLKNAKLFTNEVLSFIDEVKTVNKKNYGPFVFNANTDEILGKAKLFKDTEYRYNEDDLSKFVFYSNNNMDANSDNIPDQWTLVSASDAVISAVDNIIKVDGLGDKLAVLQSRLLNLQAGAKYKIEVELADHGDIKQIPFNLTGTNYINSNLVKNGDYYTLEVEIPSDFKSDNSYLQLIITAQYKLKTVMIYKI